MSESQPRPLSRSIPENTNEHFQELLEKMLAAPERQHEVEQEILATFSAPRAILVLDMSGFSRITRLHGIIAFLLMIYQMRKLCTPIIAGHHGTLVKAEADNLFCLFDEVKHAVEAAREIMQRLEELNTRQPADRQILACIGIGYGETLYVGEEDLFGDEMNIACKLGEDIAKQGDILLSPEALAQMGEEAAAAPKGAVSISGLVLEYRNMRVR